MSDRSHLLSDYIDMIKNHTKHVFLQDYAIKLMKLFFSNGLCKTEIGMRVTEASTHDNDPIFIFEWLDPVRVVCAIYAYHGKVRYIMVHVFDGGLESTQYKDMYREDAGYDDLIKQLLLLLNKK
mgnify:CR=1 FL=1